MRYGFLVTVHSPCVQTNAGQLPALQTHAWRDHVERKAVPLRVGVNGYDFCLRPSGSVHLTVDT